MRVDAKNLVLMCCKYFLIYRGPNLRKSLTDRESKYNPSDSQGSTYSLSSHETFESRGSKTETSGGGSPRHEGRPMPQEDRLIEVITTPGGVRLQPSREAVQNFLTAAVKLDGDRLGYALQSKLQAHAWQVDIISFICFYKKLLFGFVRNFRVICLFLPCCYLSQNHTLVNGSIRTVTGCEQCHLVNPDVSSVPGTFESHVCRGSHTAARR